MNERNFTVTGVLYVYQNKRYCNQSCGNLFLLREGFSEHEVIKYINQQNHACAIRREYDVRWQYADSSQAEVQNKCIRYACCRSNQHILFGKPSLFCHHYNQTYDNAKYKGEKNVLALHSSIAIYFVDLRVQIDHSSDDKDQS